MRKVLESDMTPKAEAYCFATARAQSLRQIVRPALDRGVVLIDVPVEIGLARKEGDKSQGKIIRLDKQKVGFYEQVRASYLEMADEDPERWVVVDGEPGVEKVAEEILSQVLPRIPKVRTESNL